MADEENIIKIDQDIEIIYCDGGKDSLGHPTVYYSFDKSDKIVCDYCGKIYIKNKA